MDMEINLRELPKPSRVEDLLETEGLRLKKGIGGELTAGWLSVKPDPKNTSIEKISVLFFDGFEVCKIMWGDNSFYPLILEAGGINWSSNSHHVKLTEYAIRFLFDCDISLTQHGKDKVDVYVEGAQRFRTRDYAKIVVRRYSPNGLHGRFPPVSLQVWVGREESSTLKIEMGRSRERNDEYLLGE